MKRLTPFIFPIILAVSTYFILIKDYEKSNNKILTTKFNGETIKFAKWDKYTKARSGFYMGKCHVLPIDHPIKLMYVTKTEVKELSDINMKDVSSEDIKSCIYNGRMFNSKTTNEPYKS
jgi:hypothetical protein